MPWLLRSKTWVPSLPTRLRRPAPLRAELHLRGGHAPRIIASLQFLSAMHKQSQATQSATIPKVSAPQGLKRFTFAIVYAVWLHKMTRHRSIQDNKPTKSSPCSDSVIFFEHLNASQGHEWIQRSLCFLVDLGLLCGWLSHLAPDAGGLEKEEEQMAIIQMPLATWKYASKVGLKHSPSLLDTWGSSHPSDSRVYVAIFSKQRWKIRNIVDKLPSSSTNLSSRCLSPLLMGKQASGRLEPPPCVQLLHLCHRRPITIIHNVGCDLLALDHSLLHVPLWSLVSFCCFSAWICLMVW